MLINKALAHETYVLSKDEFASDMADRSLHVWRALENPTSLKIALAVAVVGIIALMAFLYFERSKWGMLLDQFLKRFFKYGQALLRIAVGAAFIFSAFEMRFLGPEIPLNSLFLGELLRILLYAAGVLLVFGYLKKPAAIVGLVGLLFATIEYKTYMFTYTNYLGELIAILFLYSEERYKDWEIFAVRASFGVAIFYPAVFIKLMHPRIIEDIYFKYSLHQFAWLFPSDPLLVALGSGLTEAVLGILLILGVATRLSAAIIFAMMMMSVLFFKESVWPHYALLATSLYLFIAGAGKYSITKQTQLSKE